MGSEALVTVTVTDARGQVLLTADGVKAVLESGELVLRAPVRRTFVLTSLDGVETAGPELRFHDHEHRFALRFESETAAVRWAAKASAPPPTLASKLGVSPEHPAVVLGRAPGDEVLLAALDGCRVEGPQPSAVVALAEVDTRDELEQALIEWAALPTPLPLWVVHGKGATTAIRADEVRLALRERGFTDTKVSAVSSSRGATRYSPPRPHG
ncbi:hypothetical protein [Herbiconiux sp. A18JL235]|uniref:Siderophore-interacting protein n=1 Tax=Herbiconiux sp. A18JL235 TaxID=3152363 RepID=A0AB39BG60_9MICO